MLSVLMFITASDVAYHISIGAAGYAAGNVMRYGLEYWLSIDRFSRVLSERVD